MNSKLRSITNIILIVTALIWAIYDLIAYWQGGEAVTISRVILDFSEFSPSIVFIFVYLCGHFFASEIKQTKGIK